MEIGAGVVESLKGKSILVTGSTGFLAKIFVEKILRVQPQVKKLHLLLRAPNAEAAARRLQADVLGKELFRVLKEKHGVRFEEFISEKVSAIAGDISEENLGVQDPILREKLWSEIDVVVNVAATTNFFERYDVALNINVLGAKHALEFARNCSNIQLLLHVSTAYVAGTQEGLVFEKKFRMGETLNGSDETVLDIDAEIRLMKSALKQVRDIGSNTKDEEKVAMRQLGLQRARHFGWPNTYVFTKAMGEMLLGDMRGDLPLVIIRPTIVTSVYNDPIPGWTEGIKTIDSWLMGYANGKLPCFLADPDLVMDTIPGDMVSNAMIVALAAHVNRPIQCIYHVGSSVRNPVRFSTLLDCAHRYFSNNPMFGKDGRRIQVVRNIPLFRTIDSFKDYMNLRYGLPLQGLRLVNNVFCRAFARQYNELNRRCNFVMQMVEVYGPFSLFKGWFDDSNSSRLRFSLKRNNDQEEQLFEFDPKPIDWENYLLNIHIPGLLKYACK